MTLTPENAGWLVALFLALLAYVFRPRSPGPSNAPTQTSPTSAGAPPRAHPLPRASENAHEPPPPVSEPPPGSPVRNGLGRDHADEFVRSVRDDL
jgi:hypothetical protein